MEHDQGNLNSPTPCVFFPPYTKLDLMQGPTCSFALLKALYKSRILNNAINTGMSEIGPGPN